MAKRQKILKAQAKPKSAPTKKSKKTKEAKPPKEKWDVFENGLKTRLPFRIPGKRAWTITYYGYFTHEGIKKYFQQKSNELARIIPGAKIRCQLHWKMKGPDGKFIRYDNGDYEWDGFYGQETIVGQPVNVPNLKNVYSGGINGQEEFHAVDFEFELKQKDEVKLGFAK
jgi:hypothetical protein